MRPRYCREGEGKGQRQRYSEGMCRVFQKVIPELFGGHSLAGLRKCFGQVSNNNKKSCRDATRLPPNLVFPCISFGESGLFNGLRAGRPFFFLRAPSLVAWRAREPLPSPTVAPSKGRRSNLPEAGD